MGMAGQLQVDAVARGVAKGERVVRQQHQRALRIASGKSARHILAVRRVHQGLRVVDPALATDSLIAGESPLTQRETEVLRAARDGASVATIAKRLFLSEGTVRNHLSSAIGKTGAANRAEAVITAEGNGWL